MIRINSKMPQYKLLKIAEKIIRGQDYPDNRFLKIEEGVLYCTDSKRALAIHNFFKADDGFYIIAKIDRDIALIKEDNPPKKFPDIKRVMRKTEETKSVRLVSISIFSAWVYEVYMKPETKPCIDIEYLKDAYELIGHEEALLSYTSAFAPILIETDSIKYFVIALSL